MNIKSCEEKYHLFFNNLANPLKNRIISFLKFGDRSVKEISEGLLVEQSKVSHALSSLKRCNIVEVTPKGKSRVYTLNKKTILPMLKLIDLHSKNFCGGNCKLCSA